MNQKIITIAGQTIELPFTEEEYQKILEGNPLDGLIEIFEDTEEAQSVLSNGRLAFLAIGLHLAEKAREDEIEITTNLVHQKQMTMKKETPEQQAIQAAIKFIAPFESEFPNAAGTAYHMQRGYEKGYIAGFEAGKAEGFGSRQGEVDALKAKVKELEAGLADFKKEHESIVAYYKEQVACLKEEFKVRFRHHQKRKTNNE